MSELVPQVDEAEVKRLYKNKQYAKIEELRKSGALAGIMGQPIPVKIPEGQQWSHEEMVAAFKAKDYAGIEAAKNRGDLDDLLGIER